MHAQSRATRLSLHRRGWSSPDRASARHGPAVLEKHSACPRVAARTRSRMDQCEMIMSFGRARGAGEPARAGATRAIHWAGRRPLSAARI